LHLLLEYYNENFNVRSKVSQTQVLNNRTM
jgi:hypothetical protein